MAVVFGAHLDIYFDALGTFFLGEASVVSLQISSVDYT